MITTDFNHWCYSLIFNIIYILYIILVLILNCINCNVTYSTRWNYYNTNNLLILISHIPFDILLYGSNILINFNSTYFIYLFIEQYNLFNIILFHLLLNYYWNYFIKHIFLFKKKYFEELNVLDEMEHYIRINHCKVYYIHILLAPVYIKHGPSAFSTYGYAYVVSQYCNMPNLLSR